MSSRFQARFAEKISKTTSDGSFTSIGNPCKSKNVPEAHLRKESDKARKPPGVSDLRRALQEQQRANATLLATQTFPAPQRGNNDPEERVCGMALNERLVKTELDQLAFSRKHRKVDYRPYTTKEYLVKKPEKYYELGRLPADLQTTDLQNKRALATRVKQFSDNLRKVNATSMRKTRRFSQTASGHEIVKAKQRSARHRALEFSKTVPKPRVVRSASSSSEQASDQTYEGCFPRNPTLNDLEAKHERAKLEIDAIRREFGSLHET